MYKQEFQREVDVNFVFGSHTNISFYIGNSTNKQRRIIVMPFFARYDADMLTQQSPVELRALITVSHDCFEPLCNIHFEEQLLC
ncbi:hypothetical protein PsorP6_015553 [Peronosclerospora sorghi]|uniref:Uncharacterized protein n=1 Tax=Peronosclerospora sorghi TaxID=230839 RepID=A0ACC0WNX0_9STRA|nr:hypothetical protein PsorP6_015553 [Peronosclerospora sorghi]